MGEAAEMVEVAQSFAREHLAEGDGELHLPFENLLFVWRSPSFGWVGVWLERPQEQPRLADGIELFVHSVFYEDLLRRDEVEAPMGILWERARRPADGSPFWVQLWEMSSYVSEKRPPREPEFVRSRVELAGQVLALAACLVHSSLYLVEKSPVLTPRETRRAAKVGHIPNRKRPRVIVLDLMGLRELRRQAVGGESHAPPTPHERRGHWRRLAERCRLARAEGNERVFVRPSVVGDPHWSTPQARYRVVTVLDQRLKDRAVGPGEHP